MKCVKVLKKDAERVKNELLASHVLAEGYKVVQGRDYVYFPVGSIVDGYSLVEKNVSKDKRTVVDVGAYDVVGDIVVVGEEVSLSMAKKLLLRKGVRVVLRRKGIHSGEFRTQKMTWVAGEKRKETVHKENGVSLKLDVEKCYFSPRLGNERMRIARMIKRGEQVLVLFSGVASYPLVFAKHSPASLIVGVEKNPVAHKYALHNCRKWSQVKLFLCDAKEFQYQGKFDHVLMPLPKSAEEFLDVALRYVKKGGVVHFYDFAIAEDIPELTLAKIKSKVKDFKVLSVVKCGQYGPRKYRVCVDFQV